MAMASHGESYLVSGGSGGIGAAVCRLLAARGDCPIVGYRSGEAAAHAVAAALGGRVLALDLGDERSIDAAVEAVATADDSSPPLAGIVLAASPPPALTPFARIEPDEMHRQWQVNVAGPQRLLAGLVRRSFQKRKRGAVVAVLSAAMGGSGPARPAAKGMGAYVIAKHGLAGLLAAVAAEYPWLRVGSVSPGYTRTRMLDAFDPRFLELQARTQRFLEPEEVAREIVAALRP
jgi:3-oxoacyl-[acyl-carrier protein] reductase